MKAKLLQLLSLKEEQYQEIVINIYIDWCASKTTGTESLQKVLTCQPLFKWWECEFNKLELEFIEDVKDMPNPDPMACFKAYCLSTDKIFRRFHKPTLKYAHEPKSITQQN